MTTLAKSLSKSNPKELSRPLNELVDVEIVAYDEEDNPRGGQKLKFWSLTPFGEQILAPFFRWLPNGIPDEMKKPIGSAEQKIGLPKANPADVKFYLDRILDRKRKILVRDGAIEGLLEMCRQQDLPLYAEGYEGILIGLKKLLHSATYRDLQDNALQALTSIGYNSTKVKDNKAIECLRKNFLPKLKQLQQTNPWKATPALDTILSHGMQLETYKGVMKKWMRDMSDDATYNSHLQSILHHFMMFYIQNQNEMRDWLFKLIESSDERVSLRASDLHKTLIAGPSHLGEVSVEVSRPKKEIKRNERQIAKSSR